MAEPLKFNKVFIPGNVPSLKNSKIKTKNGVFMSRTCKNYLKSLGIQKYSASKKTVTGYKDPGRPNMFNIAVAPMRAELKKLSKPYLIGFYFVRATRHKFDFINMAQIICDLLTAHGVIDDDDIDNLIPVAMCDPETDSYYHIDKQNPGVWLYY